MVANIRPNLPRVEHSRSTVNQLAFIVAVAMLCGTSASAQTPIEKVEYYGQDAIGSIRIVFDTTGTALGRQDYEPFDGALFSSSAMPSEGFIGQERDDESTLNYFHARLFQRRSGRFTRPDPVFGDIFEPQRLNRYSYALNAPLVQIDVNGLDPDDPSKPPPIQSGTVGCIDGTIEKTSTDLFEACTDSNSKNGKGHSGSAVQLPSWWDIAYTGVDEFISAARKRLHETQERGRKWEEEMTARAGPPQVAIGVALPIPGGALPGIIGKVGERALAAEVGGVPQMLRLPSGTVRFIDRLANGIAHEAKTGYAAASEFIRTQIAKDVALRDNKLVTDVAWYFYKSPVTGKVGPSSTLAGLLRQAGIRIVMR